MKNFWIVVVVMLFSASAFADTVRLTDGTVVKGTIVSQNAQKIVIDSDLGRMEIPRHKVAGMDFGNAQNTAAPAGGSGPNIIINQNVTQNAGGGNGGSGGGALSEESRRRAVIKLEQMVRSKEFLNKKKALKMADQAALLPYEYRALLLDKHKIHGAFGYGLINAIIPSVGSFMQGDVGGGLTTLGLLIGGTIVSMSDDETIAVAGGLVVIGGYVWNIFQPGGYEKFYNRRLREGLAVYYSQLPSLDAPLFASSGSSLQVPVVSFKF